MIGPKTQNVLQPITGVILHRLLRAIPFATPLRYDQLLYSALFLISYHACMRAGEVVHSGTSSHTLQVSQISVVEGKGLQISFLSYKHNKGQQPKMVLKPQVGLFCPVAALQSFLKIRGKGDGPLFLKKNGRPLKRLEFSNFLKECLELEGLPAKQFNTHSFRIGRATQLARDKASEATIKATGRWKSNAYQKYIRPCHFTLP